MRRRNATLFQFIVDVCIAKIHTSVIMRDAALKISHDELNKKKVSESTAKTQHQRSEEFNHEDYSCCRQHIYQHEKHKENVNNYSFLIINVLRIKK